MTNWKLVYGQAKLGGGGGGGGGGGAAPFPTNRCVVRVAGHFMVARTLHCSPSYESLCARIIWYIQLLHPHSCKSEARIWPIMEGLEGLCSLKTPSN